MLCTVRAHYAYIMHSENARENTARTASVFLRQQASNDSKIVCLLSKQTQEMLKRMKTLHAVHLGMQDQNSIEHC